MDKTTSARLRDLCSCITIAQRANLKAIVEGRHSGLAAVIEHRFDHALAVFHHYQRRISALTSMGAIGHRIVGLCRLPVFTRSRHP